MAVFKSKFNVGDLVVFKDSEKLGERTLVMRPIVAKIGGVIFNNTSVGYRLYWFNYGTFHSLDAIEEIELESYDEKKHSPNRGEKK